MADSIQVTMMDDEYLENLADTCNERGTEQTELVADLLSLKTIEMKIETEGYEIKKRILKIESQVDRLLPHLKIALPSEIIVTDKMPKLH